MSMRGCERVVVSQPARLGRHPLSSNRESRSIMRLQDIRTREVKGRLICVLFEPQSTVFPLYLYRRAVLSQSRTLANHVKIRLKPDLDHQICAGVNLHGS